MTDKIPDDLGHAIANEKASLLPDRYYIMLRPSDEDKFHVTLYDTTDLDPDEYGFPHAAEIIIQGFLAMLEEDPETLFAYGAASLEFNKFKLATLEEEGLPIQGVEDNIIRVNFEQEQ